MTEAIELALFGSSPNLITGETGTGKELFARLVHQVAPQQGGTLVVLDCTTIVPTLSGSELFGHVRGAFTIPRTATDQRSATISEIQPSNCRHTAARAGLSGRRGGQIVAQALHQSELSGRLVAHLVGVRGGQPDRPDHPLPGDPDDRDRAEVPSRQPGARPPDRRPRPAGQVADHRRGVPHGR
ncbi:MAG: sigma 54-interacting transcriptional regulator [Candidatus Nanopelagicales bacterium]